MTDEDRDNLLRALLDILATDDAIECKRDALKELVKKFEHMFNEEKYTSFDWPGKNTPWTDAVKHNPKKG
jgi:hypothetical protein